MNEILCGKCGHFEDEHKEGKTGVGCIKCYISEQNPKTRITEDGFYMHEWRELNKLGNRVL